MRVDGKVVGEIGRGLLVLLGIGKGDTDAASEWMIGKLLALRIFPDEADKMNRSVTDVGGGILVVSQFTLYGELEKGTRPSFSTAMPPAEAREFYRRFMEKLRAATTLLVAEGQFAAMMDVELVNDGPVTIVLDSEKVGHASRVSKPVKSTTETVVPLFIPFDSAQSVAISWRDLPHWRQPGATYFVTFRLADSLPREKLQQWEVERDTWLRDHPPPHSEADAREYHVQFTNRLEEWLDAGMGECLLGRPAIAELVAGALRHFDGDRYALGEFVVMPNHVHVLVTPLGAHDLSEIVHSWKSFTAHEINRRLDRSGAVWQKESFDHLVRNAQKLGDYAEYIRQNPAKVGHASRVSNHGAKHNRDGCATDQHA